MTRTRIMIAEDSHLICQGLIELLEMQPDLELVGAAEDGALAVQLVRALNPDILLLDISMPKMHGLEALPLIKKISPATDVIILSMHVLNAFVIQALHFGAVGYVLKTSNGSEILKAIKTAKRGGLYLSPSLIKGEVEKELLARGTIYTIAGK